RHIKLQNCFDRQTINRAVDRHEFAARPFSSRGGETVFVKRSSKPPCYFLLQRNALIKMAFSARSGTAQRFFSLRSGKRKEGSANPASLLAGRSRGQGMRAAGRAFRVLADADRMKA